MSRFITFSFMLSSLDYDGTLVPIIRNPEESYPDKEIMGILQNLRQKYELYIVTGSTSRETGGRSKVTFSKQRNGALLRKTDSRNADSGA